MQIRPEKKKKSFPFDIGYFRGEIDQIEVERYWVNTNFANGDGQVLTSDIVNTLQHQEREAREQESLALISSSDWESMFSYQVQTILIVHSKGWDNPNGLH